jgi:tRNA 2-thiouridine synthesizing protein A
MSISRTAPGDCRESKTRTEVKDSTRHMTIKADVTVDATGLRCPEPLMVTRNRMMDMATGEVIKVIATDPSTSWDFPNFCKFLNHDLIHQEETGHHYCYWIRKG